MPNSLISISVFDFIAAMIIGAMMVFWIAGWTYFLYHLTEAFSKPTLDETIIINLLKNKKDGKTTLFSPDA